MCTGRCWFRYLISRAGMVMRPCGRVNADVSHNNSACVNVTLGLEELHLIIGFWECGHVVAAFGCP